MEHVRNQVDHRASTTPAGKVQQPLDVCAKQEIERMQIVLKTLRTTLTDLELAIDGSIVMNDLLYNAMNSLYDGRIPEHWRRISWPASNLKEWFDQVKLRYDQYVKWIETGKVEAFWLGGMFNPAGFLTSLRQQACRATEGESRWSLDQTFMQAEVQSGGRGQGGNEKDPRNAILLRGIFLEGARWGKSQGGGNAATWGLTELMTSTGRGKGGKLITDLRNEMPLIKIWPVKKDKNNREILFRTDIDTYVCPVYSNANRTDLNYIFDIPLRSLSNKAKHWVLRGVCMTTI
jgi:dynein heavy chain